MKNNRRHRYIGFILETREKNAYIHASDIMHEIKHSYECFYTKDSQESGIKLIRFNGKSGILKCHHREKDTTIQILNAIHSVASYKVKISTVGTSGTIHALIKKHMTW